MAQPKKPPLSIRPTAEVSAAIETAMGKRGLTRHAAILHLILAGAAAEGATKPAPAAPKPVKVADPVKVARVAKPSAGAITGPLGWDGKPLPAEPFRDNLKKGAKR